MPIENFPALRCKEGVMRRCWPFLLLLLLLLLLPVLGAGCPSRDLPPPPTDEPKHENEHTCGLVFNDPTVHGGSGCCYDQSAGLLKSGDVAAACGLPAAGYLGQSRDGAACRLYFGKPGVAPADAYVLVSHPRVPPGAPAPTAPDPMLVLTWKKVPLRDAIGYQATATGREAGLLEHQTIWWAGRGRRIVGLQAPKQLCDEAGARALLQKAIDAVP
jgi:hypothetical protein